ncbi:MAG: hypothetical protein K2M27_11650 [Muribaculaceae bacterium]|nr:hypothetical protein [Muribaculaceae bacterium]
MAKRFFWICVTVIALMVIVGLCGCSRKTAPQTVELRQEQTTVDKDSLSRFLARIMGEKSTERDKETVYVFRDREVTLNDRGDTVKEKTRETVDRNREWIVERERYELTIDSLKRVIASRDSVLAEKAVPVAVPVPVERKLTKWEQTKQDVGGIAIGAIIAVVCIAVIWLIRKFRK